MTGFSVKLRIAAQRAGIAHAKADERKYLGRKPSYSSVDVPKVLELVGMGRNVSVIAKELGLSRQTVYRIPALKKQHFCSWKIIGLPTMKILTNSVKQGCFLVTPCPVCGAYIAQGERVLEPLTAEFRFMPSRACQCWMGYLLIVTQCDPRKSLALSNMLGQFGATKQPFEVSKAGEPQQPS